jgi:UDP-glucose:(heptosyl)LPS alpha-1,3-glucosyltransferase
MKKIVIAVLQLHKQASGAARVVQSQIRFFFENGFEVHLIADKLDDEMVLSCGGIPHKVLRWPSHGYFRRKFYNFQAQWLIKLIKPDLVIGHGDLMKGDVLFLHNCIHLAHERINGQSLPKNSEMYKVHTPILNNKNFKHIVANSNLMKVDLMNRFNYSPTEISVCYPAYRHSIFHPISAKERLEKRKSLGLSEKDFCVALITSGNFKKRGLEIFLKASQLIQKDQNIKFWLVGKDKPNYKIEPIIHMPGRTDVETYYQAIDLFVLPARIEEFGLVASEAMACETPVLLSPYVGAAELASKESILKDLSPSTLKDAILEIYNQRDSQNKIVKLNKVLVEQTEEKKMFDHYFKIFSKMIKLEHES